MDDDDEKWYKDREEEFARREAKWREEDERRDSERKRAWEETSRQSGKNGVLIIEETRTLASSLHADLFTRATHM